MNSSTRFSLKTKILTPKLAETQGFYQAFFNMDVVEQWDKPDDKGVILEFRDSTREALLEIYHSDVVVDLSGVSLQFKTDDLSGFVAGLPDSVKYEGPKDRPWGSTYLYLRDPNDLLIIVYEGGN